MKELMNEKKINQKRLAERSTLPYQSIYKILVGERSPSLQTLEKLARGLDCKVQDFFPPQAQLALNMDSKELYQLFLDALTTAKTNDIFGLTTYEQKELFELVQKFGGWSFLREYLKEELEIRQKAQEDYVQLRESLHEEMSTQDVNKTKKNMIIAKMISEATRGR